MSISKFIFELDSASLIAGLAIVISLFVMFLNGRQVSLLNRQLQLDSLIKISDANREIISLGFEKPGLWSIIDDSAGILDSKGAEQRKKYLQLWFNQMHIIWKAWRLDLLDQDEWIACRADIVDSLQLRALRSHWSEVEEYYPRGFRKFLNSIIVDVEQTDKSPREQSLKVAFTR